MTRRLTYYTVYYFVARRLVSREMPNETEAMSEVEYQKQEKGRQAWYTTGFRYVD